MDMSSSSSLHSKSKPLSTAASFTPLSSEELISLTLADFDSQPGFVFAGAGISIAAPSCSPSWWLFMNELLQMTFDSAPSHLRDLCQLNAEGGDVSRQPEEIMESLYFYFQDKLFSVFQLLELGEPNANHYMLAHLARLGKIRGIMTTNFDLFIERALREVGVDFQLVISPQEFEEYFQSGCTKFAVMKIHGSIERPSSIVAVANHYKSGKGFSGWKEKVMAHFLRTSPTLFVGYSGWDFGHENYQVFWSQQSPTVGKPVYWLNAVNATKSGPNLPKLVGTHIGNRLVVGEGMLPSWGCDLLGKWDSSTAHTLLENHQALTGREDWVSKSKQQRQQFLRQWVERISTAQRVCLMQTEVTLLNSKSQEMMAKRKKHNQDMEAPLDYAAMGVVQMGLVQDLSEGRITQKQYDDKMTRLTLDTSFSQVPMSRSKKAEMKELVLQAYDTEFVLGPEQYLTRSFLPGVIMHVVESFPDVEDASCAYILALAIQFLEKLHKLDQDPSRLSQVKKTAYTYAMTYLRIPDANMRRIAENLIESFAQKCVDQNLDDAQIPVIINQALTKTILQMTFGLVDLKPLVEFELKCLEEDENANTFVESALSVALAFTRACPFLSLDIMQLPEYVQWVQTAVFETPERILPKANLERFQREVLDEKWFSKKVEARLRDEINTPESHEALAAFQVARVELWYQLVRYYFAHRVQEKQLARRGFYPKELLPATFCSYALEVLMPLKVTDPRTSQLRFALLTLVGESLSDLELMKMACEGSLQLTGGKVTELTPVGIPESYAYALQEARRFEEALPLYELVLEGIKTSVFRQKSDAIVLQACLVQATFDVKKALKLAFTCSPYFAETQRFSAVGEGRAILVQQCMKWAIEDLHFESLQDAEMKITGNV